MWPTHGCRARVPKLRLPMSSFSRERRRCQETPRRAEAILVQAAAQRCVPRRAGHATERAAPGSSFARNAAAAAACSCVRSGRFTARCPLTREGPDGITGMVLGASSAIHSAAESERAAIVWGHNGRGGRSQPRSQQTELVDGERGARADSAPCRLEGKSPAQHWHAACRLHTSETMPVA
jgi:hypothetical protein